MKKYTLLFLATFFFTCHSPSQEVAQNTTQKAQLQDKNIPNTSNEKLQKALLELENDPEMQTGFQGFSLREALTGNIIFEKNANKNFNVASNLKLLTTATALLVLGDDFTFKTTLEYDGNINNGVLEGNIYIKGGGDPTLGSYKMPSVTNITNFDDLLIIWANAIKNAGIKEIKGQIIADTRLYDDNAIPQGWIWGDIGNYYGAPAYALNIADNSYQINFTPANKIGEIAQISSIFPKIPDVIFTNQMKTAAAGTGDNGYIDGAPYQNTRFLHGTIPQMPQGGTFSIKGSIPDPAYLCAYKLHEILKKQNINISKDATCSRLLMQKNIIISSETKKILHTQKSAMLKDIVAWINLYSVNLYAEGVFKAVNLHLNNQNDNNQNNTENNTEKLLEFWKTKKINLETAKIEDGSGLSKDNGISPNLMTALLAQMQKENASILYSFYKSLPIAGVSGTLVNVGKNTILAGNLRAKTGSLSNAIAFSGYFKNVQGKIMCFSLVANGFKGNYGKIKPKLEKIMLIMAE